VQIDAQDYLRLVEKANRICFFDIEATGLRGDYNSVLVTSIKGFTGEPQSFLINQPGNDRRVVRETSDYLAEFDCWVSYYGKGFDVPMLNTRLLKWGLSPLPKRHHLDLYFLCKAHLLTARRSQGHLLSWLGTPEQKMTVGADMWNQVLTNPKEAMKVMKERCESDAVGLMGLYQQVKHLAQDIKRG